MSDNALSFSPTKWSIIGAAFIGAAFSNGHENQEKNQDCGNRPICCGCHKHHRENSEWVVFSDKTWWHALCAADELHRQLAQRDERIKWLKAVYCSSPSEVCRTHHVQNCHYCDNLACGDNTSEAARRIAALEARIKELEQLLSNAALDITGHARVCRCERCCEIRGEADDE